VIPSSRATSAALMAVPVSNDNIRILSGCARARMAARSVGLPETPKDMFDSFAPVVATVKYFFDGQSAAEVGDEGWPAGTEGEPEFTR